MPEDGGDGGDGGGLYASSSIIASCVVASNGTGRGGNAGDFWGDGGNGGDGGDGGGIFDSYGAILNCTIAANGTGSGGSLFDPWGDGFFTDGVRGTGGGIHTEHDVEVNNTVICGNSTSQTSGSVSTVYCYVSSGVSDPLLADPNNGNYHLLAGSPCIDTGDPCYVAESYQLDVYHGPRFLGGRIDIGADEYNPPVLSDIHVDGIINLKDYAIFASRWLDVDCSSINGWCNGSDIDRNSIVDSIDLIGLAENWCESNNP